MKKGRVTNLLYWAVVVAQLVERLLPTPEVRGSESSHWQKKYIEHFTVNCIEKTKRKKKKRPGMAHFLKK